MAPPGTVEVVRLLLVRHADALPESAILPDEHRPLSPAGRDQVRELAALLAEAGLELGAVVTSPLVRAVQTAELLVRWLDWPGPVDVTHHLAPAAVAPSAAADWLTRTAGSLGGPLLAAVGHEPSIGHLARILSGDARAPSFDKAEACLIEDGAIRWRLQPD